MRGLPCEPDQSRLSSGLGDMFAAKTSDTFEDALLAAIDALKGQIEKKREKMK